MTARRSFRILSSSALICVMVSMAHAADKKAAGNSDFSFEIGNRFWIGEMSYDYKLLTNKTGLMDSRLRWSDVNTLSNETTFRITHQRSGAFLKGYAGLGANYDGSLDDEDYAYNYPTSDGPFTGKFLDTYVRGDRDTSFYGAVDLGIAVPLPHEWPLHVSGFVGGFAQKQSLQGKGVRCNSDEAQNLECGPPGTVPVPFDQKTIGFETTMYGARVGLEAVLDVTDRLSWRNEAAYIFAGSFKLEDSHYLRTEELGPTPNVVDEGNGLDGFQLETELSWALTEKFSVNAGARYWRFNSGRADAVFGAQLRPGPLERGVQHSESKIDQYGVMAGISYKF
jgi:opacity protein-like surface antigen